MPTVINMTINLGERYKGEPPEHRWVGKVLQFRQPTGEWGVGENVQGPPGDVVLEGIEDNGLYDFFGAYMAIRGGEPASPELDPIVGVSTGYKLVVKATTYAKAEEWVAAHPTLAAQIQVAADKTVWEYRPGTPLADSEVITI